MAGKARTARRKRTTRKATPKFDRANRPVAFESAYVMHEVIASATQTTDDRTREARATIRLMHDNEGHPDASIKFDFTRFDYHGPTKPGTMHQHESSTEFDFYADELELLAHALLEAVRIGKERGVLQPKAYPASRPPITQ